MNRFLRHKKWLALFTFILLLSSVITACSALPDSKTPKKPNSIKYPIHLTDQVGNKVSVVKEPERIVSLIPSTTEIAFALGLKEQIVGVTENDDYPAEAKNLPKVGDYKIDVEKVVALKPDLVLAQKANEPETIKKLQQLGIPVLVTDANEVKDVFASIDLIAQATDRTYEGDTLVGEMSKHRLQIFHQVAKIPEDKRVKVWIEIDPTLFTAGGDTFLNELVTLAGGKNVAIQLQGWPQVSSEQVVKWNPDVILTTYGGEQEILKRQGWDAVNAIKNNRVVSVDPNLVNRPGPRIIDGVEQMAKGFYPDVIGVKK
ncbi:ABC transporter substrate-binding protein [Hazenella coriacea]|uniref:Iron complex transport system substrate-binding protein n=1 Tax=Hazenella coriacea TaxID=1179467 RepID=A0A4R3L9L6_9BACL|nr:cobalamin-binding protein [Hazenella coriacea]TCS95918.1 iron complex transport system substrate-binding protein [Hazenella coriacea]